MSASGHGEFGKTRQVFHDEMMFCELCHDTFFLQVSHAPLHAALAQPEKGTDVGLGNIGKKAGLSLVMHDHGIDVPADEVQLVPRAHGVEQGLNVQELRSAGEKHVFDELGKRISKRSNPLALHQAHQ